MASAGTGFKFDLSRGNGNTPIKYHVPLIYKGNNPMTQTQWIRFQRNKKVAREATQKTTPKSEEERKKEQYRPTKERLAMPIPRVGLMLTEVNDFGDNINDEMVSDNFEDSSEDDLIIYCNIVSILPIEYDYIFEVSENEDGVASEVDVGQKYLCTYLMGNGVI